MKKLRSEFSSRQFMLSEDFELFYYSDLHFQSVGRHSHDYTEVYLFVEGQVEMDLDGSPHQLRPGDVIVVPPGTGHQARILSGDLPYRRFVFWLSPAFCTLLRAESPDYLYLFDLAERKRDYIHHLDLLSCNNLRGKLLGLLEELNTDRYGRDTQIGIDVRDLILSLNRSIYQQRHQRTKKETLSSYQAITEYIASHLEEDLSLDALSRQFFLSKYYIAHLISERTGLSVHQYITKKRLAAVCEAMRAGETIGESCAQYGFQNYASFYRAFRKEYGASPSDYLRETLYSPEGQDG